MLYTRAPSSDRETKLLVNFIRGIHLPKPIAHIPYSPIPIFFYKFPFPIFVLFVFWFFFQFKHNAFTHQALHVLDTSEPYVIAGFVLAFYCSSRQCAIHYASPYHGCQSWGAGRGPQICGRDRGVARRASWGRRESWGSLNIIISYHVQEVCSKVVTFEEKQNNLSRSSCKWPMFVWKIEIFCEIA